MESKMERQFSVIGVFDNVRSGIRYYSLALAKDTEAEKIDMSSFYMNYKGQRDDFKSSDRRMSLKKPILIPKGDTVFVNIYDIRLVLMLIPTLLICKLMSKEIVGVAHNTIPEKNDFIHFKEWGSLSRLMPYRLFDYFYVHRDAKYITDRHLYKRDMKIDHKYVELPQSECRFLMGMEEDKKITLIIGYLRKSKNIDKFVEDFIRKSKPDELLVIVGTFWDDLKITKHERVLVKEEELTDESIGVYIKASDKVAIPYCKEESAVAYLARLYGKKIQTGGYS